MTPEQYTIESEKTEKKFPNGLNIPPEKWWDLLRYFREVNTYVGFIQKWKKENIYKDIDQSQLTEYQLRNLHNLTEKQAEFLHAGIGTFEEGFEVWEVIMSYCIDGIFDEKKRTSLLKEIGDQQWYPQIVIRHEGTDLETVFDANIAKLRERFPDKFSTESALNRDTDKEDEVSNLLLVDTK